MYVSCLTLFHLTLTSISGCSTTSLLELISSPLHYFAQAAIFIEISDGIMANSTLDVRASTRQAGDELSTALESFAPP